MTTTASPTDLTTSITTTTITTTTTTPDEIPSQTNPPPAKEYSRSSIKTAKKILSAVKQHRKTDSTKDGKVETLQLKKKEKGKKAEEPVTAQE